MQELKTLLDTFDHHAPSDEKRPRILAVREACKACARIIFENAHASADTTAALRKLHECMMTANKAIVLGDDHG